MTSAEFTESLVFEQLEPDPAEVTMRLTARLLALLSNVYRDTKQHPEPFEAADFLPQPPLSRQDIENRRRYEEEMSRMRANYTARGLRRH